MSFRRLILHSLLFYRRGNAAVGLGGCRMGEFIPKGKNATKLGTPHHRS